MISYVSTTCCAARDPDACAPPDDAPGVNAAAVVADQGASSVEARARVSGADPVWDRCRASRRVSGADPVRDRRRAARGCVAEVERDEGTGTSTETSAELLADELGRARGEGRDGASAAEYHEHETLAAENRAEAAVRPRLPHPERKARQRKRLELVGDVVLVPSAARVRPGAELEVELRNGRHRDRPRARRTPAGATDAPDPLPHQDTHVGPFKLPRSS